MLKKNLYLLYEIADREFDSKLLVSLEAAKNNFRCYIFERNFFLENISNFDKGIVVYKSVVPNDEALIKKIKQYGHYFICIDEEGILQWEEEYKYKIRYGDKSLKLIDYLILLNQSQKNLLIENYKIDERKLEILGYPRIDYLNKLSQMKKINSISQKISNKYGEYIFFPTSFPSNHLMGKKGNQISIREALGDVENMDQKSFYENTMKLIIEMENYYSDLVIKIANKYKNLSIVLRPHPTEDSSSWRQKIKDIKNIYLDSLYPSIYYLKNSLLTIQYGSTISVESFALGRIAYQYDPPQINKNLKKFELTDHNKFIERFDSFEQIEKIINKKLNKETFQSEVELLNRESNINYLKLEEESSLKIVQLMNKIQNIEQFSKKKFNYLLMIFKKRHLIRFVLWLLAKTYLINFLPQKILIGKFKILRKEYKLVHEKYYEYRKRKNNRVSDERLSISLDVIKNKNEKNYEKIAVNRIFHNNFIIERVDEK